MSVSMSSVWDRTTAFLSANLSPVAAIAGLGIFLPTVISSSLSPLQSAGMGWLWILALLSLAFGVLALWAQLAITAMALDPGAGPGAARTLATRRLPKMIVAMVVLFVAFFVLFLPVLLPLAVAGVNLRSMGQPGMSTNLSPGMATFVVGYLVLVLLPLFLFLLSRLVPTTAVVAAEDQGVGAIGRAFRLTRGLTWKLIGVVLLYIIVSQVAALAATTVFGGLFALLFRSPDPISLATVLTAIVGALVGTIFAVIGASFAAKLYEAVRERGGAAVNPIPDSTGA